MSNAGEPEPPRAFRGGSIEDAPVPDLGGQTARGSVIAVIAKVLKLGLQVVSMAVLARLLDPEDFGLIAMAAVVIGLAGMVGDFGLSAATVQRKTIDQDTLSALFRINLALGVAAMVAAIALAPVVAWFFGDPRVLEIVVAMAVPIPLIAASRQHIALLQRGMRWLALEWTSVTAQAGAAVAAILAAWGSDLGYWALVVQAWVLAGLTLVLAWIACPWRPGRVRSWQGAREAMAFGGNLLGFGLVNTLQRQMDNVLIGWRWGATDLAYYSRAYALMTLPLELINTPVGQAMIPALSRLQDQPERWRRALLDAMAAVALVASGLIAVLIAAASPIVMLVLGPGWSEAAQIFSVLALSMFPATVLSATGWIYVSLGRARRMFLWSLVVAVAMVCAFLVGLPYGAQGVATAYTVTMFVMLLPGLAFATRGTPVSLGEIVRVVGPSILAGIVAAAVGSLVAGRIDETSPMAAVTAIAAKTLGVYGLGAIPLALFTRDLAGFRTHLRALWQRRVFGSR